MKILDHGYVELVESWGSDERIVEAARMSTGKGFNGWGPKHRCKECGAFWRLNDPTDVQPDGSWSLWDAEQKPGQCCDNEAMGSQIEQVAGDEKLLRFLWENKHATPFEMAGMVIEVKAPIFVFREWHRHRTQSYNEMSARYIPLPDENYIPTVERLMVNSKTNKQAGTAKDAAELTEASALEYLTVLCDHYRKGQDLYEDTLAAGVPKEIARVHLPVGRYSRMRASANLRNWLAFLTLRMAPGAQWEIRQYANAVGTLIQQAFPRTWELFRF